MTGTTGLRVRRRIAMSAVAAAGAVDLAVSAAYTPDRRPGFLGAGAGVDLIVGDRYLLVVCGLALLLVARGVLHGKRNAWATAAVAAAASVPGHRLVVPDVLGLGVALVALAVLVALRRSFRARSDPALARRGVQTLLFGALATVCYGTAGLYLQDAEFRNSTTLVQSAREAVRLLFLLPATSIVPVTFHGVWFVGSVRFAALGVAVVGAAQLVATAVRRPGHRPDERIRVEDLLERWATTSLAPFHLLEDKNWFFADDGEAVVSYKVVGTTAVALGGPVGSPTSRRAVAAEFVSFCEQNGWAPAFHQVTQEEADLLATIGLRALKIGEEAIIDIDGWDLAAKGNKALRQALRRTERAGGHLVELPAPLDDATIEELRATSDAWIAAAGHRERTFSLGRFDPATLRTSTVLAVRAGPDHHTPGRILAFADIVPSYCGPNGNFDLMRRRPDAPNGVMETLFVGLIQRFRGEGFTGMTLGLAPLSGITGDTLPDRALRLLYERGSTTFNYEGLRRYKEKWAPRWEPRFVVYRSETDLPRIASAIVRAGELPDERSPLTRAAAVARRFPVSAAAIPLITWVMAATALDRPLHRQLLRRFGFGWRDLVHLQLWRLVTSDLLQSRTGWIGSMFAMAAVVLPLAEWRLRSARTVAVAAVSDWGSTLLVLIVLRIAAAFGNSRAAHLVTQRDAGTSSALFALAAVSAASLPPGRRRQAAAAGIGGWIVGQVVVHHRLFDVQHLVACVIALGLWAWWRHRDQRTAPAGTTAAGTVPAGTAGPVVRT